METGRQKKVKVFLFDQDSTHFATFDMPELPRVGDFVEIGFPTKQSVKLFAVESVTHKMVQEPLYTTKYVEGVPVQCHNDPPWHWEIQLHGELLNVEDTIPYEKRVCVCKPNQEAVKCPKHGQQDANRPICPECGKAVLGFCVEGEYCTSEDCKYVA